ncbi:MAG: folate-binding protein [Corynebacterium sp.]|nr:folate-binding protein [Corynebacterium sp.]
MTVSPETLKILETYGGITAPDIEGIAHFGDPLGEQRHVQMMYPRLDRKAIKVTGPDASSFLTSLFSQVFEGPVGTVGRALNLDAQGHVLDIIVWQAIENGYLLHVDTASELDSYLEAMRFWTNVNIETTDHFIFTILEREVITHPEGSKQKVMSQEYAPVPWNGPTRVDIFSEADKVSHHLTRRTYDGYRLIGSLAWDAIRVEALEPRVGVDLDKSSIPHEVFHYIGESTGTAVNLNKGCYRGQETVARVQNLGKSPRVLAMVHIDGSAPELPQPGTVIVANGARKAGVLGTVAHHWELGPIGLALIKRNLVDARLSAGMSALSVETETLVNDDRIPDGKRAIERLRGDVVD